MIGSSLEFYPCLWTRKKSSGVASYGALGHVPPSTSNNFMFSSPWSKSDSQLSKYCVVCEISWCRCQQLTAFSISTASNSHRSLCRNFLKNFFSTLQAGIFFPEFGLSLWKTDWMFVNIFFRDVSSDKEVPVKFWKSSRNGS